MTLAPVHHLLEIERFERGISALGACTEQQIGAHHATEEPVDLSEPANAVEHTNIRAVYFGDDIGNRVFRQSKRIGRVGRLFQKSHFLPRLVPHFVAQTLSTRGGTTSKTKNTSPYFFGRNSDIYSMCCRFLHRSVVHRALGT